MVAVDQPRTGGRLEMPDRRDPLELGATRFLTQRTPLEGTRASRDIGQQLHGERQILARTRIEMPVARPPSSADVLDRPSPAPRPTASVSPPPAAAREKGQPGLASRNWPAVDKESRATVPVRTGVRHQSKAVTENRALCR